MEKAGVEQAAGASASNYHRCKASAPHTRLWALAEPRPKHVADLCWIGGALGGTALISACAQEFAGPTV